MITRSMRFQMLRADKLGYNIGDQLLVVVP